MASVTLLRPNRKPPEKRVVSYIFSGPEKVIIKYRHIYRELLADITWAWIGPGAHRQSSVILKKKIFFTRRQMCTLTYNCYYLRKNFYRLIYFFKKSNSSWIRASFMSGHLTTVMEIRPEILSLSNNLLVNQTPVHFHNMCVPWKIY